mmetsp:Transcript_10657/g.16108  ORF Transcript_10657/g.16108 Transcript_10657/m.16108 type:complete len:194 (+) Transcript_10657:33-614(+)
MSDEDEKVAQEKIETQQWSAAEWREFPPLYTLQAVEETREQQLKIWIDLIHFWSRKENQDQFTISNAKFFENPNIGRKLSQEGERAVLDALVADGRAEIVNNGQTLQLYPRRPPEVAFELYDWISRNKMLNTVYTIYELYDNASAIPGSPCRDLHPSLVRKALQILEDNDKAHIFQGSTTDDEGVKFLSVDNS